MFRGWGFICTYPAPDFFISRRELEEVDAEDSKEKKVTVMDSKHKLKQNEE